MPARENSIMSIESGGRMEIAVCTTLSPWPDGREQNQDNYLVVDVMGRARYMREEQAAAEQLAGWPNGRVRLAILDGMGGHSQGREAAESVVEGLLGVAAHDVAERDTRLLELHDRLRERLHVEGASPGCTLTLLDVPPSGPAALFHVGDSRLYAVDDRAARWLTIDHVPATKYVMHLHAEEADWVSAVHLNGGSLISQAFILGNLLDGEPRMHETLFPGLFELSDQNLPPYLHGLGDRRAIELQQGCTYLLATDGFWDLSVPQAFVGQWPAILNRADRSVETCLAELLDELVQVVSADPDASGDNSTAIAFRVVQ